MTEPKHPVAAQRAAPHGAILWPALRILKKALDEAFCDPPVMRKKGQVNVNERISCGEPLSGRRNSGSCRARSSIAAERPRGRSDRRHQGHGGRKSRCRRRFLSPVRRVPVPRVICSMVLIITARGFCATRRCTMDNRRLWMFVRLDLAVHCDRGGGVRRDDGGEQKGCCDQEAVHCPILHSRSASAARQVVPSGNGSTRI